MFKYYYIHSGIGHGKNYLTSFDQALLQAGFGNYNLVQISSILPHGLVESSNINLMEGSPLHIAYAEISTNSPGKLISAAVSVGIPIDKNKIGIIMEYSAYAREKETVQVVESMVEEAMNNRCYKIKQILTCSCEVVSLDGIYTTAFSGIAIW